MESVLEFSKRCHEDSLKFTRKILHGQMFWVLFNIALLVFDWSTFVNSPSHLTAFSFGAMCVTALWSFIWMLHTWDDVRKEKLHLKYLTELEDNNLASAERQQFLNAKKEYERLITNYEKLMEKQKEKQNDTGI
jgi:hypothetical protein